MRTHRTIVLLTAAGCLALTACDPQSSGSGSTGQPAPNTPSAVAPAPAGSKPAPAPASSEPAPATTPPAAPAPAQAAVPNGVGQVLQTAQDNAQAAGFYLLGSTDALGQSRMQVLDRNWKVCSQTPAAGTRTATATKIVFNTVKLEESCP
ncbi:hypothetical protein SAVIM338S_06045 [Streptomyces avidinii]